MEVDARLPVTKDALTYKKSFNIYSRMANTSWLGNLALVKSSFNSLIKMLCLIFFFYKKEIYIDEKHIHEWAFFPFHFQVCKVIKNTSIRISEHTAAHQLISFGNTLHRGIPPLVSDIKLALSLLAIPTTGGNLEPRPWKAFAGFTTRLPDTFSMVRGLGTDLLIQGCLNA